MSALVMAASEGHKDVVQVLLNKGIDSKVSVNCVDFEINANVVASSDCFRT